MAVDFLKDSEKGMAQLRQQGAFLSVAGAERANTMTIGWGSIGFIWKRPIFMVMVRQSRFTYELIEKTDHFTVSIPNDDRMKQALTVCGTKSGRDIDKCAAAGINFVPAQTVASPVVAGCGLYYECKIVYKQPMDQAMLLPEIQETMYANHDYHVLYYGEIAACYER